jgi:DNA-binding NtrC family response regulator
VNYVVSQSADAAYQSAERMSQKLLEVPHRIKDFQAHFTALTLTDTESNVKKQTTMLNAQIAEITKKIEKYTVEAS